MSNAAEIWTAILPEVKRGVTGVGVWTALNTAKAVAFEEGVLVLGVPYEFGELSGHLRVPSTKRLIEQFATQKMGSPVNLRVMDGTSQEDWDNVKRKDAEARRLQEKSMVKLKAELEAKASWETVYEQLSRRYAAVPNKSLPQNRARFYEEAVELIAEGRKSQAEWDDLGERNFARCLERLTQYVEIPSTIVALDVLRRAGEL